MLLLLYLCPLVIVPLGWLRKERSIRFAVGLPGILTGRGSFALGVPVAVSLLVSLLSMCCRPLLWLKVLLDPLLSDPSWVLGRRGFCRCLLLLFGGSGIVWVVPAFGGCLVRLALSLLVCSLLFGSSPLLVPVFVSVWCCSSVAIVAGFVYSSRLVGSSLLGLVVLFAVVVGLVGVSSWLNLELYLRIAVPVHWHPSGS